jgi:hypothetical protein
MGFTIIQVEGTPAELSVDLSAPVQHEREDTVAPVIKKAITEIAESLGGYLSISANGNINPVSGETGDVVSIYITSLPAPISAPVPAPAETPEIQPSPAQQETAPVVEPTPVQPIETPSAIQENLSSTENPPVPENPVEIVPVAPETPAPVVEPTALVEPAV